jgi:hypothetical protein
MIKEDNLEVLIDITITHQGTQLEWNTTFQVHLLSERIGEGLEYMNYKDKSIRESLLTLMVTTRNMNM